MVKKEIVVKWPAKTIISVGEKSLTIKRKGFMSLATQGLKGEKTIPYKSITSIQLKKPGVTSGYIQFTLIGGNESRKGVFDATHDENTVMIASKPAYEDMLELKSYIESEQDESATSQNTASDADELRKYKSLLDDGIISQDEFDAKKKQLLGL
ncbi:MAG: SHOCT domain-containing protein [Sporolactobacillus sp.]